MMTTNGTQGWFSHHGPTHTRWLHEEFDGCIDVLRETKGVGIAQVNEDDRFVRFQVCADEGDYDAPRSATCWGSADPFPHLQRIRSRGRED